MVVSNDYIENSNNRLSLLNPSGLYKKLDREYLSLIDEIFTESEKHILKNYLNYNRIFPNIEVSNITDNEIKSFLDTSTTSNYEDMLFINTLLKKRLIKQLANLLKASASNKEFIVLSNEIASYERKFSTKLDVSQLEYDVWTECNEAIRFNVIENVLKIFK